VVVIEKHSFFFRFGVSNYSGYTDKAASDKKVLTNVFKGKSCCFVCFGVLKGFCRWRCLVSFWRFAEEGRAQQRVFCGSCWRHVSMEGCDKEDADDSHLLFFFFFLIVCFRVKTARRAKLLR
jgi:hypothetical protein